MNPHAYQDNNQRCDDLPSRALILLGPPIPVDVTPLIIAALSWVGGVFSTYYVTGLLERRRAFRDLASELEFVRSEFSDFARYEEIHARSVESLKPLVFAALPFLKDQKQRDARETWVV